ncbi:hypothetical protein AMK68_05010 [candidate division KD3-62 bacterium DG_56]|uniref:Uncharacterized protein n=1 Tax=candidate division KD3-62 bacterium DG_56 TaxID=1704032 RepID=A0A0S7XIS1_9BACT|nr:MAG: hypothetical protein AMK68_05010 [candidate division KD3-62 bacterium DG_56]
MLLSDKEATTLDIDRRLAWLVTMTEVRYEVKWGPDTATRGPVTWHVAIDAQTGGPLEAFSEPKPAEGWRRPMAGTKAPSMAEGWKEAGRRLDPPARPPRCTLAAALSSHGGWDPKEFGQIMGRYGRYSSKYPATVVGGKRGKKVEIPRAVDRHAWVMSFMGGYFPSHGPNRSVYFTENNNVVAVDEPGCEWIGLFSFR